MSALAEYLLGFGFEVSGSDITRSERTERLQSKGVKIFLGHCAENVGDADVVVYNDAIKRDNAELAEAENRGLYVLSRAALLSMISENFGVVAGVCGCHGKTTVTCMLAHIAKAAGEEFTAHIGGEDRELGGMASEGGNLFISEVCEFKKNIAKFTADYAVCMSCAPDHLDCYKSEEELYETYYAFFKKAKKCVLFDGDAVLNAYSGDNAVRFGTDKNSKYVLFDASEKNGKYSFDIARWGETLARINLSVYGKHNAYDALGAASVALEIGLPVKAVKKGLESFTGVKRRFEEIGGIKGAKVIADYAHHPDEIAATVAAAREITDKITVVFQPHTYSRTLFLKERFKEVFKGIPDVILYKTY
ncbi:MAG TPA: UDP-N-acetylmuramate--L-alanine ligase, partial [Clostridiales bacterium]|nr:UDP-N-acetylmuramate--L-alanine ligase [Clostridiales bacterium]